MESTCSVHGCFFLEVILNFTLSPGTPLSGCPHPGDGVTCRLCFTLIFSFSFLHIHTHTHTYTLTHKHTHSALLGNSWPQANKHSRKAAESPERINAARLPHGLTAWSFICTETPHDRQKTLFRSTVLWGTHVAASFFCSVCWAFSFWLVRQNKTVRASVHLFI